MSVKKLFYISLFVTILVSCGKEKEKIAPNYKPIYPSNKYSEADFYNFKHYLDNEYAFDIKITNIRVIEHEGVFEVEKEKYGQLEKINGSSITIEFDIKNPYSRNMRIPFPEYFQIASKKFENLEEYGYSRNLDTYTSFATNIESKKGIPLNKIGKYNDDPMSRRLIVNFEPNETKSFVVKFTVPFPSTIEKIMFLGFNKHMQKEVNDPMSLSEVEQESYLADKSTEYGLIIDLKSKKIVDLISINQ